MILYDDLAEFFRHVLEEQEQDRLWELYLSQTVLIDQSFQDWKNGLFLMRENGGSGSAGEPENDSVATVKKAEEILSRFRPEG